MPQITLEQANDVIAAALRRGTEMNLKPLTVAVVDSAGALVALSRQDGSPTLRPQVAQGKAAGAVALGMSSRRIAEMAAERPAFFAGLCALPGAGLVAAAGGVVARDADGAVLGAVGISGDTSDNDEACALAALAAVGLSTAD